MKLHLRVQVQKGPLFQIRHSELVLHRYRSICGCNDYYRGAVTQSCLELGYKGADLISFKLSLNNPSKLAELQELEHWKTKFDVASSATEGYFSRRWIAEHLFHLSEDEFLRNSRELVYDKKYDFYFSQQNI